jgi:hypothetical protein
MSNEVIDQGTAEKRRRPTLFTSKRRACFTFLGFDIRVRHEVTQREWVR